MKRISSLLAIAALGALLAGCPFNDSSNGGHGILTLDFTGFVKEQLANTSDTRAPTAVNPYTFRFRDNNNPHAYDDVLQ